MDKSKIHIYKPYWVYVLTDVILLALSFFVVLEWFPLATQIPFQKYWVFALVFSFVWMLSSYICHRYVRVKFLRLWISIMRLFIASLLTYVIMYAYMSFVAEEHNYSVNVLLTIWLAMFVLSAVFLLLFHAYHYAITTDPEIERAPERGVKHVLRTPQIYDHAQTENIRQTITSQTSASTLKMLEKQVELYSSNTYILYTSELFNVQKLKHYRFDTIINLMPLNQIRGINKMFGMVNDRLPDDGLLVCCFEPQSIMKRKILKNSIFPINWIKYGILFIYKRVIPKLVLTSRLYYDITEGKNRVLSRAEVLGRLCYCGFEIVSEHKSGDKIYIVARRAFRPHTIVKRTYGMFIKLNRVGKYGKMFGVYKFRTMHPYSEFLQDYIYKKYNLAEGGKFRHDFRITTLGHFMRKTWMDEWPMFINIIKGDMKIVGVRPISKQYFSLYDKELQEKRTYHRPGLLPPFYADMPKTIEEIQDSEMRYLIKCEERGTFITDFEYFWKILYNIIIKRARSN